MIFVLCRALKQGTVAQSHSVVKGFFERAINAEVWITKEDHPQKVEEGCWTEGIGRDQTIQDFESMEVKFYV